MKIVALLKRIVPVVNTCHPITLSYVFFQLFGGAQKCFESEGEQMVIDQIFWINPEGTEHLFERGAGPAHFNVSTSDLDGLRQKLTELEVGVQATLSNETDSGFRVAITASADSQTMAILVVTKEVASS